MKFRLWRHFEFPLQAFFISDVGIITSPLPSDCEYEKILHSRKPLSAQGQGSEWLNCFIPGDCSYMPFQSSEVKTVSTSSSQTYPHHHWPFIPSCNAVYDVLHKGLGVSNSILFHCQKYPSLHNKLFGHLGWCSHMEHSIHTPS